MDRETMKALEVRINSVMQERKKSNMQTLGFANNNLQRNHRSSVASSIPAKDVFENGHTNKAFAQDEIYGSRNSLAMQARSNNGSWLGSNSRI